MVFRLGQVVQRCRGLLAALTLALALGGGGARAVAQHGGGGGGGQPGGMPGGQAGGSQVGGGQPGGMMSGNAPPPGGMPGSNNGAATSTMRGGLQLGPPGRWWDDSGFAKSIGLNKDQQHRMDDIFKASKGSLVQTYKNLQHEESALDKVLRAKVLDEGQIDQQIDRVVRARGELEKANAHMLLEIRREMTAAQTAKLDEHRLPPNPDEN